MSEELLQSEESPKVDMKGTFEFYKHLCTYFWGLLLLLLVQRLILGCSGWSYQRLGGRKECNRRQGQSQETSNYGDLGLLYELPPTHGGPEMECRGGSLSRGAASPAGTRGIPKDPTPATDLFSSRGRAR